LIDNDINVSSYRTIADNSCSCSYNLFLYICLGCWCRKIKYCSSFRVWCIQTDNGEYDWV